MSAVFSGYKPNCLKWPHARTVVPTSLIAVVTPQTFHLGKFELLTVYLGKLDF